MKKISISLAACLLATAIWSCNNSGSTSSTSDSSSSTTSVAGGNSSGTGGSGANGSSGSDASNTSGSGASGGSGNTSGSGSGSASGSGASGSNGNMSSTNNGSAMTHLSKEDSNFVMKAAIGGMEEVSMGQVAQQQGVSGRVKSFGSMMVNDHTKANNELKSLAASKGITLPASLPASKQKDMDHMQKMTGKDFDKHYITMMTEDHVNDVAEFKRAASNAKDADLKAWASKTLPVLQSHLDSVRAIKKSM